MLCDSCDDQEAVFKVSITDMEGVLIDNIAICRDCLDSVRFQKISGLDAIRIET